MFDICFYANTELGEKTYANYFVKWEMVKQLEAFYPTVTNTMNYVNNYYTDAGDDDDGGDYD